MCAHHFINVILLAVAGIVLAECAHQDHGDKPHQEDHHHEGVEDGEPVDLATQTQHSCQRWGNKAMLIITMKNNPYVKLSPVS